MATPREEQTQKKDVYQMISEVTAKISKEGVAKTRTSSGGAGVTFKFRGIDDIYNCLSEIISDVGLVVIPRVLSRVETEKLSRQGTPLFSVVVEMNFDLISSHDKSKHSARMFGEAMDSGDKATNKAMSAAYKYMAFQTFCIPTEGDNDADSTNTEAASSQPKGKQDPRPPTVFLSESQVNHIRTLLIKSGKKESSITSFYKVDSLERLAAPTFDKIVKSLNNSMIKKESPQEEVAA
jgi:hypothetical protein